jgi:hypothetical protein
MKRAVAVAIALVAAVVALHYLQKGTPALQPPQSSDAPGSNSTDARNPSQSGNAQRLSTEAADSSRPAQGQTAQSKSAAPQPISARAPEPFQVGSPDKVPDMEPATVLSNMRIAINNYASRFGENPVGTNPEITAALNGQNSKQVKFINSEAGLRINGNGELVDYWGTPFFFHQLSGTEMEIHSAGPDRKMWTADDLVTR